ncbi:energy-coupling factor ABC transporter permease, partial [bacterium]|nr:energy-coupling factor ABC transporter permease [bacterium]
MLAPSGGWGGRAIFAVAVLFSIFQVWTATFNPLSSLVVRSVHVGFLLALTYLIFGARGAHRGGVPWHGWLLAGLSFAIGLYHWFFEHDLILRAGDPTTLDLWVGGLGVLLTAVGVALSLAFSGREFLPAAKLVVLTHAPVMAIEAFFTAAAVGLALRVKPDFFTP